MLGEAGAAGGQPALSAGVDDDDVVSVLGEAGAAGGQPALSASVHLRDHGQPQGGHGLTGRAPSHIAVHRNNKNAVQFCRCT